jgi:hypothetical protein
MRPRPGEVLHFSEDPTITRFVPHVARTAQLPGAYVWAVDAARAPDYWFPRQCPRAMAWATPTSTDPDRNQIIGTGCGSRVHAIEYGWLPAMLRTQLYGYRLDAATFVPTGSPEPHAMISTTALLPLGRPEPVGDLLRLHEQAGIQLRILDNLWEFWDVVTDSSLGFSGIRLKNALPRRSARA